MNNSPKGSDQEFEKEFFAAQDVTKYKKLGSKFDFFGGFIL